MAGCGCGGGSTAFGDGLVAADTQRDGYFWNGTEDHGPVTSALAEGALVAPDGVKVWNPDTGRTEE